MKQFIDELAHDYLVILDAPPLLPVTDAGLLSAFCDGALLVQAAGKTQIEQSQSCRRILDQVGSRLLGVVLNKAPVKGAAAIAYGGGYGSYGGYGGYKAEYASTGRPRRARVSAARRQAQGREGRGQEGREGRGRRVREGRKA